jgi:pimeloyl-ACP methyl ester carboxylesterase
MVKNAGHAPWPIGIMPGWYVALVLRLAVRGERWSTIERLLTANATEHRIQASLDQATPDRFATLTGRTVLLGGAKSPRALSADLLDELSRAIPRSTVALLPGLGHLAPEDRPARVAAAVLRSR